jgi:hypothetical protein
MASTAISSLMIGTDSLLRESRLASRQAPSTIPLAIAYVNFCSQWDRITSRTTPWLSSDTDRKVMPNP